MEMLVAIKSFVQLIQTSERPLNKYYLFTIPKILKEKQTFPGDIFQI